MAIIINMFEKAYEFDNDVIFMSHLEFNFSFKAMVTQPVQQAPVVPLVVSSLETVFVDMSGFQGLVQSNVDGHVPISNYAVQKT